jgi:hypothetical protein
VTGAVVPHGGTAALAVTGTDSILVLARGSHKA